MPPGPARAPTWAALPQELLLQAATLLGDDDRWVGVRLQLRQTRRSVATGKGPANQFEWRQAAPHQGTASSLPVLPPPQQHLPVQPYCVAHSCSQESSTQITCRLAMLHVCPDWQAALLSAPELVPTLVLSACPPAALCADLIDVRYCHRCQECHCCPDANSQQLISLLDEAAQLSPLAWHVRVEGGDEQVGELVGAHQGHAYN